jgi:hypothetical protein
VPSQSFPWKCSPYTHDKSILAVQNSHNTIFYGVNKKELLFPKSCRQCQAIDLQITHMLKNKKTLELN